MTHYAHMYTINRLRFGVRLGCLPPERKEPQPIEVYLRLYFPKAPVCLSNDDAGFIDYDILARQVRDAASKEYKLVEFLAGEIFRKLRLFIDQQDPDVRLWLKVTKCHPPVPQLEDGVSFILSDLPADAVLTPVE